MTPKSRSTISTRSFAIWMLRPSPGAGTPHDVATLRLADVKYRVGHREHFAYVQKLKLVFKTRGRGLLYLDEDAASFLEDAAYGQLPAVSWIDPNFKDFNLIGSPPNDDHPPADVTHGQELALLVYNALAAGPQWGTTLLLVFYDEHGGFFDHVRPPEHPPDDDPATFARYGVRVPAFVISPWVKAGSVSHTLFDHASIPKTILQRFCPTVVEGEGNPRCVAHAREKGHRHGISKRVAEAADLGELLTLNEPRPAPDRSALVDWFATAQAARARKLLEDPTGMVRKATTHRPAPVGRRVYRACRRDHVAPGHEICDRRHGRRRFGSGIPKISR